MNPHAIEILKVKLVAIVGIGALEIAHNVVGFLIGCSALGYSVTKWYFLVKNKGLEKEKEEK